MNPGINPLALAIVLVGTLSAVSQEWLPVTETTLELNRGSPLDFSNILPNGTISAERHLIVAGGRFALSDNPDTPQPLLCASLGWSPASGGFPNHDDADRYARQLAMHGYNIARFHFVESALMNARDRDFDFEPETLDRVHYLMAALKREGVSWIWDSMTSARGGLGGYDDRWDGTGDLKESVLLEEGALQHWKQLQARILGTTNPYTGLKPIADPALAMIILVNEGGLEFDSMVREGRGEGTYSARLRAGFNGWLRQRYTDTDVLSAAWGDLGADETLESGTVSLPDNRYAASPRYKDVQRYFIEAEIEGTAKMKAFLRSLGFRGTISNYNNWPSLQANLSRRNLDAVTMNTYFDWVGGYNAGTRIEQVSSLEKGLDYIRAAASTRWLGKPFILSEYDHLFWNRFRYEAGLAMPAMAAFQGWDGLCRHGHGPIILRYGENSPHKKSMLPYAIALDPVARAGETLAALLFRRGDVAPSRVTIPFAIDGDSALTNSIIDREPENLTLLMSLGAIGLSDVQGSPAEVSADRNVTEFSRIVTQLSASGQIDAKTAGEIADGRFGSDTGQIEVHPSRRLMRVATPRTVAVAFDTLDEQVVLGPMVLRSSTTSALFALSALDGVKLADSRRILIIFATDARNSDMRFADIEAREVLDFGHLPVMIQHGSVEFSLLGDGNWTIAPISLNGAIGPVSAEGYGRIDLELSNSTPSGPTTYFIINRD